MFGHPEWAPDCDEALVAPTRHAELIWDRQGWLSRSNALGSSASVSAGGKILLGNTQELAAATGVTVAELETQQPPPSFDAWVIKDGPWGVHARERGRLLESVDALRIQPRAAVGSGDVFAGALAAARACGESIPDSCRAGMSAAATALSSLDPLEPTALLPHSFRTAVAPSERMRLRGTVVAFPHWAACSIADEISIALGVPIGVATETTATDQARLELQDERGQRMSAAVAADSRDDLTEQLALAGLDLVADLCGGHEPLSC
jgi:hypothetical protein